MKPFRLLLALAVVAATQAFAQDAPPRVEVFKSASCSCCGGWVEHLRDNGFAVSAHDIEDVSAKRAQLGMPEKFGSCHTATVKGYVIEGHVPAADIKRLLKEKPQALGLAVPGMPASSPGMGGSPVPYDSLLVDSKGSSRVFAKH